MSKILVIADDLTGAAEIAGLAYSFGLSVSLRMMNGILDDFDGDVLVVNTDTRNLPRKIVSSRIEMYFKFLQSVKNLLVYKKTDSILRGWIETEISALLSYTNSSSAILIPANPSKNRLIRNAKYYVNGKLIDQTEFSLDPEYPRNRSEVLELIQDRSAKTVAGSIDWNNTEGKIVIPDIASEDNIKVIIRKRINSETLLCGGADFFQELLPHWFKKKKVIIQPITGNMSRKVFIFGSCSSENKYANNSLKAQGYQIHTLTMQLLEDEEEYKDWKAKIAIQSGSPGGIILACSEVRIKDASKIDGITEKLVNIGVELAAGEETATHFFITGGKTASLFCKYLGWSRFTILPGTENGVVTLSIENSKHLLTIKPGSYFWPEQILKS